ncbi:MAG: tetratricopeptide repeat protein, partial [Acidobacteriota bacterium]
MREEVGRAGLCDADSPSSSGTQSRALDLARRGHAAALSGDDRQALQFLKAAVDLDPDLSGAWNNLGVVYGANGAADLALHCFRQAVRDGGGAGVTWVNLARCLDHRGDHRRAERAYREALAVEPDCAAAWGGLARACEDRGDMVDAVLHWRRAGHPEIDRHRAWLRVAHRLLDRSDASGAVAAARRALLDRADAETWALLGYAQFVADDPAASATAYLRAVALEPSRPGLRGNVGCALLAARR